MLAHGEKIRASHNAPLSPLTLRVTDTPPADAPRPVAAPERPLSVLVLSPDPVVHGGVSVFAEMMKANLKNCDVSSLWVGSIQDQKESRFALLKRLVETPWKVARLVRRQHFDVVHINPSLTRKALLRDGMILWALRLVGYRRVLVYFHGWENGVEPSIRRSPMARKLLAWTLNGCAHIIVLSPEFKAALEEFGVDSGRITFARTMFDGESLKEVKNTVTPPQRRSILFMSRFVREKGVYELLDAFARLAAEYPDVDIIMAGDGPEGPGLRQHAQGLNLGERIQFPGYISGRAKSELLYRCTIFTLPTYLGEGMPVALLEAMGAGKPLLTARAGAIPYIIHDPDNGVVLDAVTTDNVEKAMRRLLGDTEYCRDTGLRNAAYAWKSFEAKQVTAEIEAMYHDIARG